MDVIIIGAGAAGLLAGRELARTGRQTAILEARDRTGGRIYEQQGAEFIHGDLALTRRILEEAGIPYRAVAGAMWQYRNGQLLQDDAIIAHQDVFEKQLRALDRDMSVDEFLETRFRDTAYADLKAAVRRFVSGYDTANPGDISTFAIRSEWFDAVNAEQYHINGGYTPMAAFLREGFLFAGGALHLSAIVQHIQWRPGQVEITTADGRVFAARQALVTVPLGVLQAPAGALGALSFTPALPDKQAAWQQLRMGAVIKILLEFRECFWDHLQGLSYLFSATGVPTWWTQHPEPSGLLTGWIGGARARALQDADNATIVEIALQSLCTIFSMPIARLRTLLSSTRVANWTADPFARGSYSYTAVHSRQAAQTARAPVADTLYFAGEAFYEGAAIGTVEAALVSALAAVNAMAAGGIHR